jgi:adenylate kinase family enzyme
MFDRVVVIGTSGSGKTTLARELAQRLGTEHVELDALHWLPDWQERDDAEFRGLVAAAAAGERWVIDGNYRVAHDVLWPRATAIVWLDLPLPVVFGRALRRTLRRVLRREVLFAGNVEDVRRAFLSRDSILLWVLTTYGRRRRSFEARMLEGGGVAWVRLRSPSEARRFLASMSAHSAISATPAAAPSSDGGADGAA